MKQIILTGALALATITGWCQDFKAPLEKTFNSFDTSKEMNDKIEQSNKLSLIAKKWNNEWITHYYLSFSKTVLSYMEKDAAKRDAYLD